MNETLNIIKNRSTTRSYNNQEIEIEKLKLIAKAGLQAPSAMNFQPWQIILITNQDLISRIEENGLENLKNNQETSATYERIMSRGGKLLYNAKAIIIVASEKQTELEQAARVSLDSGIVVQNMALAATSLNLGNCICKMIQFGFEGVKGGEILKELNIKPGFEFKISLLVGEADNFPEPHSEDLEKLTVIE